MQTINHTTDSHIVSYTLDGKTAADVLRRRKLLTAEELSEKTPNERFSFTSFEHLKKVPEARTFPLPRAVGELIFPAFIEARGSICFCSGYTFCYVPASVDGPAKLLLKCDYVCLSLHVINDH